MKNEMAVKKKINNGLKLAYYIVLSITLMQPSAENIAMQSNWRKINLIQ
jgi:hypothetical protein